MRIGIDISQIAHEKTGVGKYVREMVRELLYTDRINEYVLFATSFRKQDVFYTFFNTLEHSDKVVLKVYPIPPTILDIIWNILHIIPVEWFIGEVDVFWSSDWTQPPLRKARGITTIHDLTVIRFPESFHKNILHVQKRRLQWVKKECDMILCDSDATKKDCISLLGLEEKNIRVVYPGFSL